MWSHLDHVSEEERIFLLGLSRKFGEIRGWIQKLEGFAQVSF